MEIAVENGVAVDVRGADMPFTDGTLCTKVAKYLDRTYSKERLLYPLRRVGAKGPGQGRLERISWDEALDEIAARFKAIAAEDPQQILPCSYAGTMGMLQFMSMDRRFFNRLGASLLDRTLCSSAGKVGMKITLGASVGMDPERFDEAKLILIWGSNPDRVEPAPLVALPAGEAPRREADRDRSVAQPDRREVPPARAAAARHGRRARARHDARHHPRGALRPRLRRSGTRWASRRCESASAEYPPEKVARICGIAADEIVNLAREYAATRPAAIRVNYGLQRHAGGGMAIRTIACLPALVGAWREAAGGVVLSTSDFYAFDHKTLERPDLMRGNPRTINQSALGDALTSATPPVKAIYVYNNNPVAVCPDSNKVIAGFSRPDLFTVVHDVFMTDTADYADIVLPATTQLEHYDVHKSYGHLYVLANNPAIAPVGEARPNIEVFRLLAKRMGFTEACFDDSDEEVCRQALKSSAAPHARHRVGHVEGARLAAAGGAGSLSRRSPRAAFRRRPASASSTARPRSSLGLDPLPAYTPPRENVLSAPELARRYPLAFISPPCRNFLNSSFANLPFARASEKEPRLDIHPDDAAPRGIANGDRVRVFNDRGSYTLKAAVSDRARPGRRGRAVGVVEEALARRPQRERPHVAGARGHGRRGDVLRLPGRGRAGVALSRIHSHECRSSRSLPCPRARSASPSKRASTSATPRCTPGAKPGNPGSSIAGCSASG